MKKVCILLFALILAQNSRAGDHFNFGLKAGLCLADQNYEGKKEFDDMNPGSFKMLPGFTIGFVGEIPFADFIGIQAEALYTSQGRQFVNKVDNDNWIKTKIGYGYVQFPVLVKGTLNLGELQLFADLGPQFGVGTYGVTRVKTKINGDKDHNNDGFKFDEEDLHRFDMGLAAGAGIGCAKTGINFEIRYYAGLTDIADWGSGGRPDGIKKFTNSGLNFTMGCVF